MIRSILMALLAVTFLMSAQVTVAKEIYMWKADGKTHFTDNLANVPEAFRDSQKHSVEPGLKLTTEEKDRAIWKARCSSCHHTGVGKVDKKRGLAKYAQYLDTGVAKTEGAVLARLRTATQGRTSDMKPMNLSDEELAALTRFLMSAQKGLSL